MIKSSRNALAIHLGWDVNDLKDYQYQYGKFTKSVYAIGQDYWCASKGGRVLPRSIDKHGMKFDWEEVKDDFINKEGYNIFKSTEAKSATMLPSKKEVVFATSFAGWYVELLKKGEFVNVYHAMDLYLKRDK